MKKHIILLAAAAICAAPAFALPKAFYVKQGDKITKYNFGVAENLVFSDNGHTLSVRGYGQSINLDEIDYISFSAPLTEALTPSAQKERMVQIGTEAYNAFDTNDQADVLRMFHDFFDSDYSYDTDKYTYKAPVEFDVPREYYDVHKQMSRLARAVQSMSQGDAAAARVMKAAVVDLYKIEDYYGIYTADRTAESWKKAASDHFEMRFDGRDGSQYVIKLVAGKEFTTWTTKDFEGRFPREIEITLSKASTTLATARLNTVLADSRSIDMTLDFDANGYNVKNVLKIVDNQMDDNVKVTVKGREYVTANSKVLGRNFVNYDEVFDAVKAANGYYDDNDEWVDEDGKALCAMFDRAESSVDILGKLQVRGIAYNGSKIYAALSEDAECYSYFVKNGVEFYTRGKILSNSGNTYHITQYDTDVLGRQMNLLNNNTDAGFYYDGEDKLQGYLGWDYVEDTWDYYTDYNYEPVTWAFCRVDDYLVEVHRESDWNYETQSYELGPWIYTGYRYTQDGDPEEVTVTVDDSDVIYAQPVVHEYELSPVLWFPDGTSFAVEDFFDENSFSRLIDDYNEIIDTYLSITGQERCSDDDR